MANYYHSYYSTPGSSSSRASSGSPLSSVSSQSPPDSTGYFSFSSAPPSPYYYTTEYTGSPDATTNDSYQGSVSSRSSSSQGHYRHPSSSSSTSSSSYNQAAVYDYSHNDGRTTKRQRVAVPVDPTGHLQPHWMGNTANPNQVHDDFAAGMYHQHPHPQMQMSYSTPMTGRHHGGNGYATTGTATHYQSPTTTTTSSTPAHTSTSSRHASPSQTRQQKAHGGGGCQEVEEPGEEFEHGPTELPPRTFVGHSKFNPPKKPGKIPGSAMDYLPILEARFERLENAIDRYIDYRGQRALSNSILPGTSKDSTTKAR